MVEKPIKDLSIGVDLGGTNIKVALVNRQGQLLSTLEAPTYADRGWEAVLENIYQRILELLQRNQITTNDIQGVGLGIPGFTHPETGMVLWSPNLGWKGVPIRPWLEERLQVPILTDNDANMAGLGEHWAGRGQGSTNMALITIGTGIGGALILNGKIFRGSNGGAGEIGHTIVLKDGPQCNCGQRGCLEALTSATAMVKRAKKAIEQGQQTSLAGLDHVTAKAIIEAAKTGDGLAMEIIDEVAFYLGIGLANLINLLNPDLVLIGGGVSRGGDLILDPIRKYTLANALPIPREKVVIDFAQLGNEAGGLGAAAMVFLV